MHMMVRHVFVVAILGAATAGAAQAAITIVDDLPGEFTDISGTGEPLDLAHDESAEFYTSVGNWLLPAGRIVVGNNGGIGFDPVSDFLDPDNAPIPSTLAFGGSQSLLPFWDDIGNIWGNIYWEETADTLIIQWHDKRFEDDPGGDFARFQVKIFSTRRSPSAAVAQFIYDDIDQPRPGGGASATIGYQDGAAGYNDFQWSFDTQMAVSNGTVLSLIPAPGSLASLALAWAGSRVGRRRDPDH